MLRHILAYERKHSLKDTDSDSSKPGISGMIVDDGIKVKDLCPPSEAGIRQYHSKGPVDGGGVVSRLEWFQNITTGNDGNV